MTKLATNEVISRYLGRLGLSRLLGLYIEGLTKLIDEARKLDLKKKKLGA